MLIVYDCSHGLGRKDPRQLVAQVSACAGAFGHRPEPNEASVLLNMEADDDPALDAAYEELEREYGPYPRAIRGTRATDGHELRAFLFLVPEGGLEAAFDRVAALQARGGLLEQRAGLKLVWKFRLRDPDTRELLPGQDDLPRLESFPGGRGDSSSIVLNLGRTSSIALWLMFPFEEPDEAFRAYSARLQAALPTAFSPKGWRRWKLAKSGAWKSEKLAVPVPAVGP